MEMARGPTSTRWASRGPRSGLTRTQRLWPALSAWVASGAYVAAGNGSVPVPSDFIDHLHGEFDSWADFVEHWLTETDYFDHWPEAAQTYFDAEKFGRDLAFDFTTMPSPAGGIFVFSNP